MTDSLKLAAHFVAGPQLFAAVAFQPEDVRLGDYGFVPFVREGLAAAISADPAGGETRAKVRAAFEVAASDGSGAPVPVSRELTLYGPGDVTRIDLGQIIRREPVPGTWGAEETFLVHVEFDRPDFPWLFTPLAPQGDRLDPWLALVVCEKASTRVDAPANDLPGRIWTRRGQLQSLDENWRFAHAQVVGAARADGGTGALVQRGPAADTVQTRLSADHAPANLSRVVCPRRLADSTSYVAALVPAFDCGVRAGLGIGGGTLQPAWSRSPDGSDAEDDIVLPCYDVWEFATAPDGDFRSLAEKIRGVAAPWPVGRRRIDVRQPGGGLPALDPGAPGAVRILECALYSPAPRPADAPTGDWPVALRDALRRRVDEGAEGTPELPRVAPRLYAKYQRAAARLGAVFGTAPFAVNAAERADGDWFAQINTAPEHRIVAGLGTRVVQKDQEKLMQAAWAQVDGIRKANAALVWAGFAQAVGESVVKRHLEPLELGVLAQVTRTVHARIRDGARPRSVWAAALASRVAEQSLSAAFRRQTRPAGPTMRRLAAAAPSLVTDRAGFRDHRRPYANPDGITGISDAGLAFFPESKIAAVLGVPERGARDALRARIRPLAETGTALTQLTAAASRGWQVRPGLDPGAAMGELLLRAVERTLPARVRPGTAATAGPAAAILAGIATASERLRPQAGAALQRFGAAAPAQTLNFHADRPPVRPDVVVTPPVTRPDRLTDLEDALPRPVEPGHPDLLVTRPQGGVSPLAFDSRIRRELRTGPVVVETPGAAPRPVRGARPAPEDPAIRFSTAHSRTIASALAQVSREGPARLVGNLGSIVTGIAVPPAAATDLGPLTVSRTALLTELKPSVTALRAFEGRLRFRPEFLPEHWFDRQGLRPIMAAPVFKRPMYEALDTYDRDWLIPGLGEIPSRNFVTLLKTNAAFSEAFLVGLSDEMGRELLWRNYPTDQRGTYFMRFWDADADELTGPIHRFSREPLARHFRMGGTAAAGGDRLVLVVRGELVRRYPELIVSAMRASSGPNEPPVFVARSEATILFHAHLSPDYVLVGFDLTEGQVLAGGWWFILAEQPTAPRFGLAEMGTNTARRTDNVIDRDDLDWDDMTLDGTRLHLGHFLKPSVRSLTVSDDLSAPENQPWPGSAATVARALLRNPFRAAFRGDRLIRTINSAG